MQVNKLFPQYMVQVVYVSGVRPVAVVDSGECYVFLLALKSCIHHMRWIDRMNVIGRKCAVLLLLVYRLLVEVFSHRDRLQYRMDHILLRNVFIRLNTRQTKWRHPFHWITGWSDYFGTFGKPLFNIISISKKVSDALNCYSCEILGSPIKFPIRLINPFILQLPLNLFPSSNECYAIYWGHYCLFYYFSGDIPLQPLNSLIIIRVIFFFHFLNYQF